MRPVRLLAVATAVALAGASCTDGEGGEDGSAEEPRPGHPEVAVGTDARVSVPDTLGAADVSLQWRTVEFTAEPKGGTYLGHELLSSPGEDEAPLHRCHERRGSPG